MIFKKETSLLTLGDFLDVYHKIRQKGLGFLLSKVRLSANNRVASKWDSYVSSSDFWLIPEISQDWNRVISGNKDVIFEDYVADKYLKGKTSLSMLSVGCGKGLHERNFAKYPVFSKIKGIDISEMSIVRAREMAEEHNMAIDYEAGDFYKMNLEKGSFDVILFHSSLHHFSNISNFLKNHVKPLLKDGGLLVIFEFSGPNRLQWKNSQLEAANRLLQEIPKEYKTLYDGKTLKKKVYRPGIVRMLMVDPSEAPDSANLVQGIHDNFSVLEEKKLGWNITHPLLKGIAHNFLNDTQKTKSLLAQILEKERQFVAATGENDAVFGVYQKNDGNQL